jgi:hypothetical protein
MAGIWLCPSAGSLTVSAIEDFVERGSNVMWRGFSAVNGKGDGTTSALGSGKETSTVLGGAGGFGGSGATLRTSLLPSPATGLSTQYRWRANG